LCATIQVLCSKISGVAPVALVGTLLTKFPKGVINIAVELNKTALFLSGFATLSRTRHILLAVDVEGNGAIGGIRVLVAGHPHGLQVS